MTAEAASPVAREAPAHIVHELGFDIVPEGDGLRGRATVSPYMYVPGTDVLRTSILAVWTDLICGLPVVDVFLPRVPTTLSLEVHVLEQRSAPAEVIGHSRLVKVGRSVVVVHVDFTDGEGRRIAIGSASFMAVPDPSVLMPDEHRDIAARRFSTSKLAVPFAERAGCRREAPGVAVLTRSEDGLNSSKTVNGGLIALAIEEAALSAVPAVDADQSSATLASMAMHYLRPIRRGPAVATADLIGAADSPVCTVEVRDAGGEHRLAVHAVTRLFPRGC
jgi:acyl-coenzyme A thioesterase PaaI-like protein